MKRHRMIQWGAGLLTFALLSVASWGCTNLSPSSECNEGEVQCDGTTAMRCEAVGGSKSSFDTHNEWIPSDCAAAGMICVTDGTDDVGCALSETPCDLETHAPRCDGADTLVVCVNIFDQGGAFEVASSCADFDLSCKQGSVSAACALPDDAPCDPSQEGTCDGDAVFRCSESGLGGPSPCEAGSTCEPRDDGFSFCSAGTCDTRDAITCDADQNFLFACWPAPGADDDTLYLRPYEACTSGCQDTAEGAVCLE